jgi:hypothetical protein
MNYVAVHALFTNLFRYVWPHDGTILFVFFRAVGLHRPKSERDEWIIRSPPSYRGGRHYGSFLGIFIMSLSYGVVAPLMLPLALLFFFTAILGWRYSALHFYEPCYESGGAQWKLLFSRMVFTVWIANLFASCVVIAKGGYWVGGSLAIIVSLWTWWFRGYCKASLEPQMEGVTLSTAASAPAAHIPREMYLPPPMRRGAVGWFPECTKIWEKYGLPRFTG